MSLEFFSVYEWDEVNGERFVRLDDVPCMTWDAMLRAVKAAGDDLIEMHWRQKDGTVLVYDAGEAQWLVSVDDRARRREQAYPGPNAPGKEG